MNSVTRRRWKADELAIARLLGGERVPVTGRTRGWAPDVRHDRYAIEVKSRLRMPVFLAGAMDQASRAAEWSKRKREGHRIPLVVIHQKGQVFGNALVVVRLADYLVMDATVAAFLGGHHGI